MARLLFQTFFFHFQYTFFPNIDFKFKFIYFNWRLNTLQYCISFAIHQHESAMGVHPDKVLNKDCVNQVICIQRFSFAQRKHKHRHSGRKTPARKHTVCNGLLCGMRYNSAFAILSCQPVSQIVEYYFIYLLIYFWLLWVFIALCGLSLVVVSRVAVHKLLTAVASLVAEYGLQAHQLQQLQHVGSVFVAPGLQSSGSIAMALGLSCSTECGIFPDQGLNSGTMN